MAINWIEVNRTALRTITIAERGDEAAAGRTDAVVAAAQYIMRGANSAALNYRIDSELARRESEAYRFIPAGSSDGVLFFAVISTTTDGSTGISASSFVSAGLVGPPYNFSSSSQAFHYLRSRPTIGQGSSGVTSTRYFWGTRAIDVCI